MRTLSITREWEERRAKVSASSLSRVCWYLVTEAPNLCLACCIHRPAREFGESSDESSDDSSSSDESDTETKRRSQPVKGHKGCNGDHKHNLNRDGNGQKKSRRRPPSPNAYERMPKIQSKTLPQKSAK